MAGDWLKMEVSTPEKPEVLAITVKMGWDDPDLTVGKLFRLWRWFDQHTVEGNAASVTSALLDRIVGVTGFSNAVASVGWLIVTDDGITLPNFDRHNGATAKSRGLTAKRVNKHKVLTSGNAKGNAASVTEALPREEKRREEVNPLSESSVSARQPSVAEKPQNATREGGLCRKLRTLGVDAAPHVLKDRKWQALLAKRTDEEIVAVAEIKIAAKPGQRINLPYLYPAIAEDPKPPPDAMARGSPRGKQAARDDYLIQQGYKNATPNTGSAAGSEIIEGFAERVS